ncbi:toxin-antitoxin system HicB family antitoxin [Lottiidibacillus patelloidae]|uniref:Toxin-antitoxin system HicB family antitoxin n=1 Tax=Lottiidibacillus patelloidae TaxID=2670334 RepID=A0A263BUL3_9BACI|nr:Arc family DNA-binding protein [Lottiidibacillus patelloidae]OZM57007.1 toxin-antitoxin system HicB family antitoxin [Lottiidibacillus patelloidae]
MPKKKSFPLRIDPELYEVLQKWAADEFRSVNSHIEYLLRESSKKAGRIKKEK